jgi:hypothetical protein
MAGCGGGGGLTDVDIKDFPPGTIVVERESLATVASNTCGVIAVVRNTRQVTVNIVDLEYDALDATGMIVGHASIFFGLGPGEEAQRQAAFTPDRPCSAIQRFERTRTEACCTARIDPMRGKPVSPTERAPGV